MSAHEEKFEVCFTAYMQLKAGCENEARGMATAILNTSLPGTAYNILKVKKCSVVKNEQELQVKWLTMRFNTGKGNTKILSVIPCCTRSDVRKAVENITLQLHKKLYPDIYMVDSFITDDCPDKEVL